MHLLQKFTEFIKKENLFQKEDKLLLAVSGGVDSVVLCELCKQAGYHFMIAHCNFQLRDDESKWDEQFVTGLAEKYDTKIFVKTFETEKYAAEKKISTQVAARELRYQWFLSLLEEKQTNWTLTAHHANDNIETLLINFFKGTGINGLRGILSKNNKIVRPLLFARKEELLQFSKEYNLNYVEDSSNASDKYTRNYFRNQLIPVIQKVFPQAEENLLNNIQRFNDIEKLYYHSIGLYRKNLVELKGNEIHIPVLKLLKSEPLSTIIYEIIKEFGFTSNQTDEVIKLLHSDSGKYVQSASYRIIRNRKWLIISPIDTVIAENILIDQTNTEIDFALGKLKFETLVTKDMPSGQLLSQTATGGSVALLDAGEISFPLLLRKWKVGDYFYPLGMKKKKKLSRFFIDQKLSMTEKENIWLLEGNKKIIWIVGKRIDDRFKITANTKSTLKISLS